MVEYEKSVFTTDNIKPKTINEDTGEEEKEEDDESDVNSLINNLIITRGHSKYWCDK